MESSIPVNVVLAAALFSPGGIALNTNGHGLWVGLTWTYGAATLVLVEVHLKSLVKSSVDCSIAFLRNSHRATKSRNSERNTGRFARIFSRIYDGTSAILSKR